MEQIAVFVDAGYVYTQGAALISGENKSRNEIEIDVDEILTLLRDAALDACPEPEGRLLRIYWYDVLPPRGGRLDPEQVQVAKADYAKLRLATVTNKDRHQKQVDALLVTDLIDLARNDAITDALIVTSDDDGRIGIGIQVAQTFGVQVHLLCMKPVQETPSTDLMQESDTYREWTAEEVRNFLSVSPGGVSVPSASDLPPSSEESRYEQRQESPPHDPHPDSHPEPYPEPQPEYPRHDPQYAPRTEPRYDSRPEPRFELRYENRHEPLEPMPFEDAIETEIRTSISQLDPTMRQSLRAAAWAMPGRVPPELDRPTLARIGNRIGRNLTDSERKEYRARFSKLLGE